MLYTKFPTLETTMDVADKDMNPGSFFINNEGEASIVLEDGTERVLLDSLYRTLADMLNQNKVHLPSILDNVPANNTQLQIKGDVPSSVGTYSVHDIIVEVNTDTNEIIRKRLSRFTLGSDVTVKVNRTGETKPISEVIDQIMVVDFSLDEYMDVNTSNKKLMVSESGCSIDSVILRLRKMDNPMSETDLEKYVHVILTGAAGLEILKGVDILLNDTGIITSLHVDHVTGTTPETAYTYSYDLVANNVDNNLNIVFDEKNSDIYSVVSDGTLYIKHRKFTKYTIDITTPVAEKINYVKSIVMTNNGHISQINIGDYEGSSLDINRIYYTKKQMSNTYLDSATDNTTSGGFKIPDYLTVKEDVTIDGTFSMSETTKKVVINTENTSIKDSIITIGTDNDGSAEAVGMTFRSFFKNNTWTKNMMDRATFTSYGGTVSDVSTNTVLGKRFSYTQASLAEYTPEYYNEDSTLSTDYYVSDLYFDLDSQDVNSILANVSKDIINDTTASMDLNFNHVFARFVGLAEAQWSFKATFEFKRKGAITYETWEDLRSMRSIGTIGAYVVENTYDIDSIRFRINAKLAKEVIDALGSSASFYFDLMPLNLYVATKSGVSVEKVNMTQYATKYISSELSNTYPNMKVVSSNENDIISGYSTDTGFYSYGTYAIAKSCLSENLSGKVRPAIISSFESGFLGITDSVTKHKRMNIKTQLYITHPANASDATKQKRVDQEVTPSTSKYIYILKPYVSTYSEMIQTLGVSKIYKDDYGRTVDESTSTVMRAFSKDSAHALTPVEIPMEYNGQYATVNTDVLFDLGEYVSKYSETIDLGQGVLGPNKLYYYFEIVLVRNTSDADLYNNFDDGAYINNTIFEIYDLKKEYRSIINDSIIDPAYYDDASARFIGTNWSDSINTTSGGYTVKGPGVSSAKNYLDGLQVTLEKSLGVPYSTVKMAVDAPTGYDRRLFQTNVVVNKVTNNLMKIYAKLGSIDTLFNTPGGEHIKVWIAASYITTDSSDIKTYTGLKKSDLGVVSGDTYEGSTTASSAYGLYDSKDVLDYGEPQTFATNMTDIGTLFYTQLLYGADITKLYYDLNNVADNVDLAIHVMVSVPYNIKESVYDTLTFTMDTLDIRLCTDIDYKNFDPEDGYLASYAMLYRKSSDVIELVETKYDKNNKELYSSQTANLSASKFLGNVTTMSALETDLKISMQGSLSGEFDISGYNEYAKKIKMSAVVTAEDIPGITGLTSWNPTTLYIPYDTVFSSDSIKSLIEKAQILNRRVHSFEYDGDDGTHGTNTVASAKAVRDLNKEVERAIVTAESAFMATYNAMVARYTFTTDLLTKTDQKMNDYFRQDRMVNIGSQAANNWVKQVISNVNKGTRIGGTILSIGGKVQILSSLGKLAGGVLYGTIGTVITTLKTVVNAVGGFVNKIFGKTIFKSKGGKGGDPGVNFYLINVMRTGGQLVNSASYPYDVLSTMSSTVVWDSQDDVDGGLICRIYFPFELKSSIFEEYRALTALESAYYTGCKDIVTELHLQRRKIAGGDWTEMDSFIVIGPTTIYDIYPGADKPFIETTPEYYYRIVKNDYFYRNNGDIVERAFGHTVSERIRSNNAELYRYIYAKVKYTQYFTPPWSEPKEQIMSVMVNLKGFQIYNTAPNVGHSKHGKWFFDDGTYYSNQESMPAESEYQYGVIKKDAPNGHLTGWAWLYQHGPRYYTICREGQSLPEPVKTNLVYRHAWTTYSGGFAGFWRHKHYNYKTLYRLRGGSYLINTETVTLPIGSLSVYQYCKQYIEFMKAANCELSAAKFQGEFRIKIIIKRKDTGAVISTTNLDMGIDKCYDITADGPKIALDSTKLYTYTVELWKTSNILSYPAVITDTDISHIYYDLDGVTFPDLLMNINYTIKI